jgi:phosphatidylserine/phosphatidylglycerophosphate/cardiolipin synthase-like enzyme
MKQSRLIRTSLVLSLLIALIHLLAGCLVQPSPLPTSESQGTPSGWYSIFFTDPLNPAADTYRGGPDDALAAAIKGARLSVDVAIYDLNLWSLRNALLDAHRRGLEVRVVTESDNLDEPEIQALQEAGIPVLGDRRESLMHHKFVVIDRLEVWTGSMNFTTSDTYLNDNNMVRLRSSRLAEDYTVEFEEMFVDDRFATSSPVNTPHTTLTVDGTPLEVYFSPEDGTLERLLALIQAADSSIYFMLYSFTSDEIAEAMLARAAAGIQVRGVLEETQYMSNIGTEYDRLRTAGLDVWLDGNPRNMHHKVLIIDERILVTGSYNFSANAEKSNDENTLIIHSSQIVLPYMSEFERVYAQATE